MKEKLIALSACNAGLIWAGDKSLYEIWVTCERGDWMLWLLRKLKCDLRLLAACKAACAEFARPHMNDARSIAALDAAHAFGRGELSEEGLKSFAEAARAADDDDAAAYAASYAASYDYTYPFPAAYAASVAASAAVDNAYAYPAVSADADADADARAAAYAAAYAAARAEILKKCADEVRRLVSVEKITELNNSND